MMMGFGGGWFTMFFMLIFWLFFLALAVVAVIYLVRYLPGSRGAALTTSRDDPAMEILRKRYASGEITKEEYEEAKKALS